MKKLLCALLFLLSGCQLQEFSLVNEEAHEEEQYDFKVSEEMKAAKKVNANFDKGENKTVFMSEEQLDLKQLVHLLSFLIPYDIKVTQSSLPLLNTIKNTITIEFFDEDIEMMSHEIDRIIAYNIDDTMNTTQKIDFVHKFIIDHSEYDESVQERTSDNEKAFQVEGVMKYQSAVCSGYARTFLLFMKKLNIPCLYVSSDVINHSFNLVYNQDFYFIDTTWDETNNQYYGLDSETFFADGQHTLEKEYNREYFLNFLAYVYLLN